MAKSGLFLRYIQQNLGQLIDASLLYHLGQLLFSSSLSGTLLISLSGLSALLKCGHLFFLLYTLSQGHFPSKTKTSKVGE